MLIEEAEPRKTPETQQDVDVNFMRSPTRSLNRPSTALSCGPGHRPRWQNIVGRPYHTDYNGQSIPISWVTGYGIEQLSCVFQCPLKGPQVQHVQESAAWFIVYYLLMLLKAPKIWSIFHTGDSSGPQPRTSSPTSRTEQRSASICTTCGKTICPRTCELGGSLVNKIGQPRLQQTLPNRTPPLRKVM